MNDQELKEELLRICNRSISKTLSDLESNNCPVHLWKIVGGRLRLMRNDMFDLLGETSNQED